jgi:hypothetical protein
MAGLFCVVRPSEQQLHQLNQASVSYDVPGILRADGENTIIPRAVSGNSPDAEANTHLGFTLCTKGTRKMQSGNLAC